MDKARLFLVSTTTKLRAFFPSVKPPSNPRQLWLKRKKQIWSYILYYQVKGKPPKTTSKTAPVFSKPKPPIRAMAHFVNHHPEQVFFIESGKWFASPFFHSFALALLACAATSKTPLTNQKR